MKFYAIGSIIVLVAPLCFGTITGNGDKIEPAFDGGSEYSLIAEPNEDDGLNLTEYAKFKGMVKELNDGEAIVAPCENEVIFQAGDLVAVELPDGCQLTVGEEVTVEYDGDIMEGYPLRVNVVSVNGIAMDIEVQSDEDFLPDEDVSTGEGVTDYSDIGDDMMTSEVAPTVEPEE